MFKFMFMGNVAVVKIFCYTMYVVFKKKKILFLKLSNLGRIDIYLKNLLISFYTSCNKKVDPTFYK